MWVFVASQEEELYDAIFNEIKERWEHLEEIKHNGAGAQHEGRTRAEVRVGLSRASALGTKQSTPPPSGRARVVHV